jgi:ketosteroid isomerase-like protein
MSRLPLQIPFRARLRLALPLWLLLGAGALTAGFEEGRESEPAYRERVRDEIWALELAIYRGRGLGNLQPYLDALASDYQAWPPFRDAPAGAAGLEDLAERMRGQDQEELEMTFLDFSLNGDTAAIYYRTHRTRKADGSPADDHYEVIHVWVKEDGVWRVFAGMARDTPER